MSKKRKGDSVTVANFQKVSQKGDFPKNSRPKRGFYCEKGEHNLKCKKYEIKSIKTQHFGSFLIENNYFYTHYPILQLKYSEYYIFQNT